MCHRFYRLHRELWTPEMAHDDNDILLTLLTLLTFF
jgi:hypothetical protein